MESRELQLQTSRETLAPCAICGKYSNIFNCKLYIFKYIQLQIIYIQIYSIANYIYSNIFNCNCKQVGGHWHLVQSVANIQIYSNIFKHQNLCEYFQQIEALLVQSNARQ